VWSAVPDSPVDDELSDAEGEQGGQVIVVLAAATLADSVAGVTGWSIEVERYWIAFYDCFAAGLTRWLAIGGWFYLQVR
jgi:hypothetical protein